MPNVSTAQPVGFELSHVSQVIRAARRNHKIDALSKQALCPLPQAASRAMENKIRPTLALLGIKTREQPVFVVVTKPEFSGHLLEIIPVIADGKQFLAYLDRLGGVVPPDALDALVWIAAGCRDRLWNYDPAAKMSDDFLSFLGVLGPLVERLDVYTQRSDELARISRELVEYLAAVRGKYLKEYALVSQRNILVAVEDELSLARLHDDVGPTTYQRFWNEALDVFHRTLFNPHAADISNRVKRHLYTCIDVARAAIRTYPELFAGTEKLIILDRVEDTLRDLDARVFVGDLR